MITQALILSLLCLLGHCAYNVPDVYSYNNYNSYNYNNDPCASYGYGSLSDGSSSYAGSNYANSGSYGSSGYSYNPCAPYVPYTPTPTPNTGASQPSADVPANIRTVTVNVYIRYSMAFADFIAQNYLPRYILSLATLLGISTDVIVVTSLREGSTIIESQVVFPAATDDQLASAMSQAQVMTATLNSPAAQGALTFGGLTILDFKSAVNVVEAPKTQTSSNTGLIVGLSVGLTLGVLGLGLAGYLAYRHMKKVKSVVRPLKSPQSDMERSNLKSVSPSVSPGTE